MTDEMVLGNGKFVLPLALFLALIAGIIVVVRLDTKVDFLINQNMEERRKAEEEIKIKGLEINNLRIEVAELRGLTKSKNGGNK